MKREGRCSLRLSPRGAVVGVAAIEVATANVNCRGGCGRLAEGFRTMLETAIVKSRKMRVYERARLDGRAGAGAGGLHDWGGLLGLRLDHQVRPGSEGFSTKGLSSFGGNLDRLDALDQEGHRGGRGPEGDGRQERRHRHRGPCEGSVVGRRRVLVDGKRGPLRGRASGGGREDIGSARIPFKIIKVQATALVLNYGDVFLREETCSVQAEDRRSRGDPRGRGYARPWSSQAHQFGIASPPSGAVRVPEDMARSSRAQNEGNWPVRS